MNTRLRSLRTLIAARRRQQARLEEALAAQQAVLAERRGAADAAESRRQACTALERGTGERRRALLGGRFAPADLVALDLRLAMLAADTAQAAQAHERSLKALDAQQEVVRAAQRALQRNARRIESFEASLATLVRERDQAAEEAAEEESGEGFTARLAARARAARETQDAA